MPHAPRRALISRPSHFAHSTATENGNQLDRPAINPLEASDVWQERLPETGTQSV